MKKNDFLLASINNLEFTPTDMKLVLGLTLDNTQFLSKDLYKLSDFIRKLNIFKDDEGNFSETKFNLVYNYAANQFKEFSSEDIVDNYEYSMWDVTRPVKGRVKKERMNILTVPNPEHISIGVEGINKVSLSDQSRKELALNSKIFDSSTGKFLDYSVNDISLFSNPIRYVLSLFADPLVYATYDKDTEEIDPLTGLKTKHYKGEWKVNDDGEYYVESLNGRSLLGKEVVSFEDYMTSENSFLQKYDFMDSDGMDKSVSGVITKNLAAVLPMFTPLAGIYSGVLVTRELSKALPMLYGMVTGLTSNQLGDSKLLNTVAAYGQKFTGGTSEYAKENVFSLENFGNLLSDVALQWGQQLFVVNSFTKLTGGTKSIINGAYAKASKEFATLVNNMLREGKMTTALLARIAGLPTVVLVEKDLILSGKWLNTPIGKAALNKFLPAAEKAVLSRVKLGQDLSLAYMAIISNTDVYDSVLQKGGSPLEAAAIALGSTLGMWSVDKYLGLGEMFFLKDAARIAFRNTTNEAVTDFMKGVKVTGTNNITKKGIIGLIDKGISLGKKSVEKYLSNIKDGTLSLFGKAIGEGLEEVSEELVTDFSKSLGELAGKFGYFSQTDYGAWDNAFERYTMSFLGGTAGGAMFGAANLWLNRNASTKEFQNDLSYYLRQGKKKEIFAEFDKAKKSGIMGSTLLSYDTTTDDKGNVTYLTADKDRISQADTNYNILKNIVELLDLIINGNLLNISDDELFNRMVLSEYRGDALTDFLKGDNIENIKNISYISRYLLDFLELTNKIVDVETQIKNLQSSIPDPNKRNDSSYEELLKNLEKQKKELLEQKEYLFGEGSLGYVEKTLFAMDTGISSAFLSLTFNLFVRDLYGRSPSELTKAELENANKLYKESNNNKENLDTAFKLFKEMGNTINPLIETNSNISKEFLESQEELLNKIINVLPLDDLSKLDSETDEDYQALFELKEGETEADLQKRINEHIKKVREFNITNKLNAIKSFAENFLLTKNNLRLLSTLVGLLKKDVVSYWFNLNKNLFIPEFSEEIKLLLSNTNIDLLNGSILSEIEDLVTSNIDNDDLYNIVLNKILANYKTAIVKGNKLEDLSASLRDVYDTVLLFLNDNPGATLEKIKDAILDFYEVHDGHEEIVDPILEEILEIDQDGNPILKDEADISALDSMVIYSEDWVDLLLKLSKDSIISEYQNLVEKFLDSIKNTKEVKALDAIELETPFDNPVFPILNAIAKYSLKNIEIDKFLLDIYLQYLAGNSFLEFQLSTLQLLVLTLALKDFDIARAYIKAATNEATINNPVGHNKSINDFVRNHKDVFGNVEELPEIDVDFGNYLLNSIDIYQKEIESWIDLHEKNSGNRDAKFIEADKAMNEVFLLFFDTIKDIKITPTLDLLDGIESIDKDKGIYSVVAIEELIRKNYLKAVSEGATLNLILDSVSKAFNVLEAVRLQSGKLDETFNYSKFTDYDKFRLLVSCFATSSVKFYKELNTFLLLNQKMAPLAIQEFVGKMANALKENPQLINEALEWLKAKTSSNLPIAYNTTIVTGLGGSGKTFASARLSFGNGKNVWLSGPTSFLELTLQDSLKEGEPKSKEDLFKIIFGGTYDLSNCYVKAKNTVSLKKDLKLTKLANPPKYIVIDEITHFNTVELLILSEFCKLNNILLLGLGDFHLNGFNDGKLENIGEDVLLAWRTPELYISLRNNSVLKVANLKDLIYLIDKLDSNKIGKGQYAPVVANVIELLNKLSLQYNISQNLSGEQIVKDINDEILSKIPKTSEIGFIGSPSSDTYKKLVDKGYTVSNPMSSNQIQGREYDYVVVDLDWKLDLSTTDNALKALNLLNFLRDLYTIITRSREGTLILDNGLSKIVKNNISDFTGTFLPIDKSIERFRKVRIPQIEEIVNKIEEAKLQVTLSLGTLQGYGTSQTGQSLTGQGTSLQQGLQGLQGLQGQQQGTPAPNPQPNPLTTPQTNPLATPPTSNPPSTSSNSTLGVLNGDSTLANLDLQDEGLDPELQEEQSKENKKEVEELLKLIEELTSVELVLNSSSKVLQEMPVSVFTNVSYSGIDTSQESWNNTSNSRLDLGIFLNGEIKDGKDKSDLVLKLLKLKSFFIYNTRYLNLALSIKDVFAEDDLNNATFHIEIVRNDSNLSVTNRLVGLTGTTGLYQKYRNLVDKEGNDTGFIFKLVAKVKNRSGEICTVSLGGLNNVNTWAANSPTIIAALLKRLNESTDNDELAKLRDIIDNYPLLIDNYNDWIHNLISSIPAELDSITIDIEKPDFDIRSYIRSIDGEYKVSTYDRKAPPQVESDIYIDIDPQSKHVTRAFRFQSPNMNLDPGALEALYRKEIDTYGFPKSVHKIMLGNTGISFSSLYKVSYKDKNTIPISYGPLGVRMYESMWNYRADLIRFINKYKEFLANNNVNESDVIKAIVEDNNIYNKKKAATLGSYTEKQYFNDQTALDGANHKDLILKIREFNLNLGAYCRGFRLGYSTGHGAYIRYLSGNTSTLGNVKDPVGIYINPEIARTQLDIMSKLFDNIITPIVGLLDGVEELNYISRDLSKGWYKQLQQNLTVSFNIEGKSNQDPIKLDLPNLSVLHALPIYIIKFARFSTLAVNWGLDNLNDPDVAEQWTMNFTNKSSNVSRDLDWIGILTNLSESVSLNLDDTGLVYNTPGIVPYKYDNNGNPVGIRDARLLDMFNLMFHGLIATTEENNFLNKKDLRASFALFKYGFFTDAMVKKRESEEPQEYDLTSSNRDLFTCNAAVTPSIATIRLGKATAQVQTLETTLLSTNSIKDDYENLPVEIKKLCLFADKYLDNLDSLDTLYKDILTKVNESLKNFLDCGTSDTKTVIGFNKETKKVTTVESMLRDKFKEATRIDIGVENNVVIFTVANGSTETKYQMVDDYNGGYEINLVQDATTNKSIKLLLEDLDNLVLQLIDGDIGEIIIDDMGYTKEDISKAVNEIFESALGVLINVDAYNLLVDEVLSELEISDALRAENLENQLYKTECK